MNIENGMPSLGIIDSIIKIKDSMPRKQKKLCDYIIENYQNIGLFTIKELSEAAGVGISTIIRLMNALGYKSYSDMRRDLHEVTVNSSLATWWHLQKSFEHYDTEKTKTLSEVWEEVIGLLDTTINGSLMDSFPKAIDMMLHARRINILGLRSSKAPAIYFEHLIQEFYPKVRQLSHDSEFIFDKILQFEKDEILVLIAHSPYTNLSIEAAHFCHKQGVPIVLITDHLSCPAVSYASTVLKVTQSEKQYSIVPTITLIEAMVIEMGRRTSDNSVKNLQKLSSLLNEMKITRI